MRAESVLGLAGCLLLAAAGATAREAETPARPPIQTKARPVFRSCELPVYPPASKRRNEAGTVVVSYLVSKEGAVVDSKVTRSSGYGVLDIAASTALAKCRFEPARIGADPIEDWAEVTYIWKIN